MRIHDQHRWAAVMMVLLSVSLSMPTVRAHQVPGANLQLIAELQEELLVYEINAETSLVPPLAEVQFGGAIPTMEAKRAVLEEFFRENCPVAVDGIAVAPILEDIHFEPTENQVNLGEVTNFVMAYFIFHYPLKSAPQRIDMRWSLFLPDRVKEIVPQEPDPTGHDPQTVDSVFYTNGELDLITFKPSEPQFIWHTPKPILSVDAQQRLQAAETAMRAAANRVLPLAWPIAGVLMLVGLVLFFAQRRRLAVWQACVLGVGIVGSFAAYQPLTISLGKSVPDLAPDEALQRFRDLHQNIYRAFDYDSDEEIYDTLAQSVTGDLLDEVYQEVFKSLIMKDEGGAVCRVRKVDYVASVLASDQNVRHGYAIDCHWTVSGLVKHWGHTHERVNEYEARYEMSPQSGVWRISAVKVGREKRLNPDTMDAEN